MIFFLSPPVSLMYNIIITIITATHPIIRMTNADCEVPLRYIVYRVILYNAHLNFSFNNKLFYKLLTLFVLYKCLFVIQTSNFLNKNSNSIIQIIQWLFFLKNIWLFRYLIDNSKCTRVVSQWLKCLYLW